MQADPDLALGWSRRWSLGTRILAVNIFALALLAGGFFYLDSYRARLIDQRVDALALQSRTVAAALEATGALADPGLFGALGRTTELRLRLYRSADAAPVDSWRLTGPTYELRDPAAQGVYRKAARVLDRAIDAVVAAPPVDRFVEPATDTMRSWPEAAEAFAGRRLATRVRRAPDLTPVLSAALPVRAGDGGTAVLLATTNARDITRTVRAERLSLGIVLLAVVLTSVLLSLFLARTIVRPLRRLAIAAQRVRLGRSREVQVPRLPWRRDEIGALARALSDMTQALRQRMDATEAFAADVTHELKNPLASLRSAIDTLERIEQPDLRDQLMAVAKDDVRRLDRLITDISEASRLDAELSRARFEPIDLGPVVEGLIEARERRGRDRDVKVAFARPRVGVATVLGDGARLSRVVDNLVDNAVSFSPRGGLVCVSATRDGDEVLIQIDDQGPGVPIEAREAIFNRFHSLRPEGEAFGRHSGLGLAIAKAIVEGHNGTITVEDRDDVPSGARFTIRLQAADQ